MKEDFINAIANRLVDDWNYSYGEKVFNDEEEVYDYVYCTDMHYNGVSIIDNDKLHKLFKDNLSVIFNIMYEEIESQIDYAAGMEAARDAYYSDLI